MNLIEAIHIDQNSRIAIVGAGGKTSILFALANAYPTPVILATTTRVAEEEAKLADEHAYLNIPVDLLAYAGGVTNQTTFFTGKDKENKIISIELDLLDKLENLAALYNYPMIIEADGANNRWFKAPAAHEPPIPEFTNNVIICVNINSLGLKINDEMVHRNQIIAALINKNENDSIDEQIIADVLSHPNGGLKNAPHNAKITIFINGVDSEEKSNKAKMIAAKLKNKPRIDKIIQGHVSYREKIETNIEIL